MDKPGYVSAWTQTERVSEQQKSTQCNLGYEYDIEDETSCDTSQCDQQSPFCMHAAITQPDTSKICSICEIAARGVVSDAEMISIDDLPDEIIVKILSHFSFNELVDTIQNVCVRWRKLAHDPELWRDKVYIIRNRARFGRSCCGVICTECIHCRCEKTDEEVLRTIRTTPQLRTVIMQRGTKRSVLRTLYTKCHNLTTLQIHGCQKLTYSLLKEIFDNCPKIHTLLLPCALLTDRRYVEIVSGLKQLQSLALFECEHLVEPVQLRLLAYYCPRLDKVDFGTQYYPLEDLRYFLNAKSHCLTSVALRWTMEGKRCVIPLLTVCAGTLEQIHLYLYDVVPEEEVEVFTALSQFHKLRDFMAKQMMVHQCGVVPLAFKPGCLPHLRRIDLRYTDTIDNDVILAISLGCPALRELRLHHSPRITDAALEKIYCLKQLEVLDLTACDGLGGAAIPHIAQLPVLHTLMLQYMTDLGRLLPGLQRILDMRQLVCLNLLHSGNLKAVPFQEFPGKLLSLREIHACHNEGPFFLNELCELMPHLRIYETSPYTESDWETDYETDEDSDNESLNLSIFS